MENLARMEGYKQASTLFADCTSSNGGMFAGILSVIAVTITCVVLLTMGDCDYDLNQNISNSMRIVVFAILIATSAYCYYIVACLEVNPHPISLLDDMLLFFCMPAFFLYGIVSMGPLIVNTLEGTTQPDAIIASLLFIIQPLVQTPMIVDGLRRCTNDPEVMKKMPGRNVITFLIVGNLATYLMETMLFKNTDSQKDKIEFYGADTWTVFGHMTIPITIFYRSFLPANTSIQSSCSINLSHLKQKGMFDDVMYSGSTRQLPWWTSGTRPTSRQKTIINKFRQRVVQVL